MKGLIAEIDGRNMIVITEKGDFVKVKRNIKYGIGDEIQLPVRSQKQLYKALSAVAASIVICVLLGSGVYAYYTPYSYVSVDINPSLGLSLNRFEKVIEVQPLNEDAQKVISTAKSIKYREIDDAMSAILQSAAKNGYLKQDQENGVMVVVSAKEKSEETRLMDEISSVSKEELAKVSSSYNVMLEKASVSEYKSAMAQKTSPGKLKLAEKVIKANPSITQAEVKDMSVKQAIEIIKGTHKAYKEEGKAAKEELKTEEKAGQQEAGEKTGKQEAGAAEGNANNSGKEDKNKPAQNPKANNNTHKASPAKGKGNDKLKPAGKADSGNVSETEEKAPEKDKSKSNGNADEKDKKKEDSVSNEAPVKSGDSSIQNNDNNQNSEDSKDSGSKSNNSGDREEHDKKSDSKGKDGGNDKGDGKDKGDSKDKGGGKNR